MSSEEPTVAAEPPPAEPVAPSDPPQETEPEKPVPKPKKAAREPKPKKPAAPRSRNPPAHPPYEEVTIFSVKLNSNFPLSRFLIVELDLNLNFNLDFADDQGRDCDAEGEERFEPIRDYEVH